VRLRIPFFNFLAIAIVSTNHRLFSTAIALLKTVSPKIDMLLSQPTWMPPSRSPQGDGNDANITPSAVMVERVNFEAPLRCCIFQLSLSS